MAKRADAKKAREKRLKEKKAKTKGTVIFVGTKKQQQQKKGPTMIIGISRPGPGPK